MYLIFVEEENLDEVIILCLYILKDSWTLIMANLVTILFNSSHAMVVNTAIKLRLGFIYTNQGPIILKRIKTCIRNT